MTRYEYRTLLLSSATFLQDLNKHARDGWRLIGVNGTKAFLERAVEVPG